MAVIVVSYNSAGDLEGCLNALAPEGGFGPVVVIDNASNDNSVEVTRQVGGNQVQIVAHEENTGFAGGCNRGYELVRDQSEYFAFMNPDVRIEPDCIERCINVMKANPQVGCVAPLLMRPDGATIDSVGQVLKWGRLEVRDRGYGERLDSKWLQPCQVLAACGALAVFRRKALESVMEEGGPWAEPFFCFWEDLELGWRLNNAGWEVWFEPTARAEHGRGAGAARGEGPLRWRRAPELEACIITNRWMTLVRHLHGLDLVWRAPVLLAWDFALIGAGIIRRPSLVRHLLRRLPLVWREMRGRWHRPRKRLSNLPC